MKRFLLALVVVLLILEFPCYASEYLDYLDSFDLLSFETLDDDTYDLLEEFGLSDFDYENITDISFNDIDIIDIIMGIVSEKAEGALKPGIVVIAFIILSSLFKFFGSRLNSSITEQFYETISNLVISVFLVTKISNCIALCASTVKLCSDFSFAFFPAFCIIVAASGFASASFSVNTTF